jgi:hypothetical protein
MCFRVGNGSTKSTTRESPLVHPRCIVATRKLLDKITVDNRVHSNTRS